MYELTLYEQINYSSTLTAEKYFTIVEDVDDYFVSHEFIFKKVTNEVMKVHIFDILFCHTLLYVFYFQAQGHLSVKFVGKVSVRQAPCVVIRLYIRQRNRINVARVEKHLTAAPP